MNRILSGVVVACLLVAVVRRLPRRRTNYNVKISLSNGDRQGTQHGRCAEAVLQPEPD